MEPSITEEVPGTVYIARLHTGAVPGPYMWASTIFRTRGQNTRVTFAGDCAEFRGACGTDGVPMTVIFDAKSGFVEQLRALNFRRIAWRRWDSGDFRWVEFKI